MALHFNDNIQKDRIVATTSGAHVCLSSSGQVQNYIVWPSKCNDFYYHLLFTVIFCKFQTFCDVKFLMSIKQGIMTHYIHVINKSIGFK